MVFHKPHYKYKEDSKLGIEFGETLGAFFAKGVKHSDDFEVLRNPSKIRPWTMWNVDSKYIAGAAYSMAKNQRRRSYPRH